MLKKILKEMIRPSHMLAVLFLCFIVFVGVIAFPAFLINTGTTLENTLDPLRYIQTINGQYSGMLETDADLLMPHNKGSYIDLNGFMAKILGQPMMNQRVTLKNGHLSSLVSEMPDSEEIQAAADNIIQFYNTQKAADGDFLFVMVSTQISKYDDLLPRGYIDTTNETADIFLTLLEESNVPYLDLREQMQMEGISVTDSYYTTDHHWKPETGLWAYGKILEKLQKMDAIEAVDPYYTDPENYIFETYENTFLGSSGKRTGKYYAGVDDSCILRPAFDNHISVSIPRRSMTLEGHYEDVAYNTDVSPDYNNPDFFNENIYGMYGWGDMPITHWRNENAPVQEKFLLIGESFGNIPFSLMSLCISSCDEVDMRHFEEDFQDYYESYQPDTVVILINVSHTISEFTDSYLK